MATCRRRFLPVRCEHRGTRRGPPFTRGLRAWGASLPRPAAILSVSVHWLTPGATAVSTATRPRTIYDFGGFPPELYRIEYPAQGAPETRCVQFGAAA